MTPATTLSLKIVFDPTVTYAFQQNAIPVIKEVVLQNDGLERKDIVVRITTDPAVAVCKEIRIQSIGPGGECRIAPVDLQLSHEFLANLAERIVGSLKVEVTSGSETLVTRTEQISVLARNEWNGLTSLPEILAAYILPNDPAIMPILGRASDLLREATGRGALNGYQDKSRKRAWEQVASIYRSIAELGIRYINPPPSFEKQGQKVVLPSRIVADRFATCLDLALLVSACCERAGLHPIVLIHEGHAYVACWLEERTLTDAAIDGPDALQHLRKLNAESLLTVFETTLLASEVPGTLNDAETAAKVHLQTEKPFLLGLDVRRARSARIVPLPIPGDKGDAGIPAVPSPSTDIIGSRDFSERHGTDIQTQVKAPTRIDQWKSRLLDLTLRNRLLNFKETKSTIRLLITDPALLEDALASESALTILPKPRLLGEEDPRDAATLSKQQRADVLHEHISAQLTLGKVHSHVDEKEHARRLTEIFRGARNALDENGTNTLFAALGLLEWRETEHSDRVFKAPLLLVPVELRRRSVLEGFSLHRIDEETRLNATLMEMLRQHFQKEIPGLDPLPEDEKGVDVRAVLRVFRDAVRDMPGWEVKEEMWLGQFSFTKFLLWKDLADRLPALAQNRVVNHLVNSAGAPYPNSGDDIRPQDLDDTFPPSAVFCPRSADSSQLAAVMAAAAGQDFVLEGPPGTGKSQTITNIIGHCLAEGKRVLFVAEKRAALDVVHRRLKEDGLEPFCLELHSNKTGKGDVLAQFDQALKVPLPPDANAWARRTQELEQSRAALNTFNRALHQVHPCGLSVFDCLNHLVPRRAAPTVKLNWSAILDDPEERLDEARQLVKQLQERSRNLGPLSRHPLRLVHFTDWSPGWAEQSLQRIQELTTLVMPVSEAARDMATWLGMPQPTFTREALLQLSVLVDALLSPYDVGASFATTPWPQLARDLEQWHAWVQERNSLRVKLSGYNLTKVLQLDLDGLEHRWNESHKSWFLTRWFASRAVKKALASVHETGAPPEGTTITGILENSKRLRAIQRDILAADAKAKGALGQLWLDGEPEVETLRQVMAWGAKWQTAVTALGGDHFLWLAQTRQLIATLFTEGASAYAPTTSLGRRLTAFQQAHKLFEERYTAFCEAVHLRHEELDRAPDHLSAVGTFLTPLPTAWRQIREWCAWQKVRQASLAAGLSPVVHARDTDQAIGDLPSLFETSFRRDFFFAVIEKEPALRQFMGDEHTDLIARFRELDDLHASLARELIRARLSSGIHRITTDSTVPRAEIGLLRKELGKRMRHIPVRRLLAGIPTLLPYLKPCVLMSPLSVAQYLDTTHEGFDIVIFDEASQIPVWDAIGAIARGRQLIIVGDPKQLPPTNFFNTTPEDEEDLAEAERDLESVLDELMSHKVRHKRLQWHYRSRHEGLITFSNRQYYENDLLTFPSPETSRGGVQLRYLPEAHYDKGKSRTNLTEAKALVAELVSRLRSTDGPSRSYGVVTFSLAQQQLVENLLDEERRKDPTLERHFGGEPPVEGEPVIIKNLENVQGDERDVILFSICYAPDEKGQVSMNFGPLNRDGGERRLNVAVTRAKHELVVFTGLRADQIDLNRTRARGVRDLRHFLDYADRGAAALPTPASSIQSSDTPTEFEVHLASRLRAAGYEVHHRVGASGYRIDLAICDPQARGRYLLGIECDGSTYRQAATARDRDKLREQVLQGLGWQLHRVWTMDWWHDEAREMERLEDAIKQAQNARAG